MTEPCPLCHSHNATLLHKGGKGSGYRDFLHCPTCDLVFVPRAQQLPPDAQRARYLQHNNDIHDPAYRAFLARLYSPLKPHLTPGSTGLDYGAGPGPALQRMMLEDGFQARIYDLYFHHDQSALTQTYDFITCTETAEHFADPAQEFARLDALLRPGGWLGIMTGMLPTWDNFPDWHYHRDLTHINFFSPTTMQWLATRHRWQPHFHARDVTLFHKPNRP